MHTHWNVRFEKRWNTASFSWWCLELGGGVTDWRDCLESIFFPRFCLLPRLISPRSQSHFTDWMWHLKDARFQALQFLIKPTQSQLFNENNSNCQRLFCACSASLPRRKCYSRLHTQCSECYCHCGITQAMWASVIWRKADCVKPTRGSPQRQREGDEETDRGEWRRDKPRGGDRWREERGRTALSQMDVKQQNQSSRAHLTSNFIIFRKFNVEVLWLNVWRVERVITFGPWYQPDITCIWRFSWIYNVISFAWACSCCFEEDVFK